MVTLRSVIDLDITIGAMLDLVSTMSKLRLAWGQGRM